MRLLGIANFALFQWFFIRLFYVRQMGVTRYFWEGPILPLSGWGSDPVYLGAWKR